jgi:hypothetical protein
VSSVERCGLVGAAPHPHLHSGTHAQFLLGVGVRLQGPLGDNALFLSAWFDAVCAQSPAGFNNDP